MTRVFHKGNSEIGRELWTCLCLLILIMMMALVLEYHPSFAEGSQVYTRGKRVSSFAASRGHRNGYYKGIAFAANGKGIGGNNHDVFGEEKRRVYTGPNPLHNR